MPEGSLFPNTNPTQKLEGTMQKVSRVISLIGLGFMIVGFVDFLFGETGFTLPGEAVLPLQDFLQLSGVPVSLIMMSAGIILLALLPTIRVILALWTYGRRRAWLNALVSLIVFLELLLSIRAGG